MKTIWSSFTYENNSAQLVARKESWGNILIDDHSRLRLKLARFCLRVFWPKFLHILSFFLFTSFHCFSFPQSLDREIEIYLIRKVRNDVTRCDVCWCCSYINRFHLHERLFEKARKKMIIKMIVCKFKFLSEVLIRINGSRFLCVTRTTANAG